MEEALQDQINTTSKSQEKPYKNEYHIKNPSKQYVELNRVNIAIIPEQLTLCKYIQKQEYSNNYPYTNMYKNRNT